MDLSKEFKREVCIATYEVSAQSILKLSVLLRICQETSEQQMFALQAGYEKLKADGIVFLISRTSIEVQRMPVHGEHITVKTHPLGIIGPLFYRDFVFFSDGKELIRVLQASVAADTKTHRILHPRKFEKYGIDPSPNGTTKQELHKLVLPEDLEFQGNRKIRYSDLDYNSHLNNAIYGDIITDFIPGGAFGKQFYKIQINYIKESKQNETLRIYAKEKDGIVTMYADHERGRCFECKAEFMPKN